MLDKLPASVRHSLIALAGALVAWGAESIHSLNLSPAVASIVGAGVTSLTLILSPLTQQYAVTDTTTKK